MEIDKCRLLGDEQRLCAHAAVTKLSESRALMPQGAQSMVDDQIDETAIPPVHHL